MHRNIALKMSIVPSKPQSYFAFSDQYNMWSRCRCCVRTNFFIGRKDETGELGSISARRVPHRY